MKKDGLLNPQILAAIAGIGHTEYLAVADAGLPIPPGIPVIDLSLIRGIPAFGTVLNSIVEEMVVESFVVAEELMERNETVYKEVRDILPEVPYSSISHEELKKRLIKAKAVIRTGEASPYVNILLVAGVNF